MIFIVPLLFSVAYFPEFTGGPPWVGALIGAALFYAIGRGLSGDDPA